nr:MAG: hypothetical protein [Molluscum contagiosum virus]
MEFRAALRQVSHTLLSCVLFQNSGISPSLAAFKRRRHRRRHARDPPLRIVAARWRGKQGLDVGLYGQGLEAVAVPTHGRAVRAHQELLEVPGDVVAAHRRPGDELGVAHERARLVAGRRQGLSQEGEERMCPRAVDLALLEEHKVRLEAVPGTDMLQGRQDLGILGVFLVSELVTREAKHHQPPSSEAPLELVHLGVLPDRATSERRHVLDEQDPAS